MSFSSFCVCSEIKDGKLPPQLAVVPSSPLKAEPQLAFPLIVPETLFPSPGTFSADGKSPPSPEEMAEHLLKLYDEAAIAIIAKRILATLPFPFQSEMSTVVDGKCVGSMPQVVDQTDPPGGVQVEIGEPKQPNATIEVAYKSEASYAASISQKAPPTILQFSSSVYYCREEDGMVELEVSRLGNSSAKCSIFYKTTELSAKAFRKFLPVEGTLYFQPGEISKDVFVKILDDSLWDTTLEFAMTLSEPQGATIGEFLGTCRVKILDDDTFPTNRFRDQCLAHDFGSIPRMQQLFEYFKMNWSHNSIRKATLTLIFCDFLDNCYKIMRILMRLYLVDYLVGTDKDPPVLMKDKLYQLICIGCLVFFPQFLLFVQERVRVEMRVAGKARNILQTNILRKFLNYEESMRSTIRQSDLIMTIKHDCDVLVSDGYLTFVGMVKELTLLLMIFAFQLSMGAAKKDSGLNSVLISVIPVIVIPLSIAFFARLRERPTTSALIARNLARNQLARCVERIVTNFRLIMDFSKRSAAIGDCEHYIHGFNDAATRCDKVNCTNKYFVPVLTAFLTAIYIVVGGQLTLNSQMSLGIFLTNLDVYAQMCDSWEVVYGELLVINSALPAMEHVTRYLNLPIDLDKRRLANNRRREMNQEERLKARENMKTQKNDASHPKAMFASDTIPLRLREVGFKYEPVEDNRTIHGSLENQTNGLDRNSKSYYNTIKGVVSKKPSNSTGKPGNRSSLSALAAAEITAMSNWTLVLPQGSLVAFIGRQSCGKGTLLKIVGGVLLPTEGDFFAPPQLRVYYVTAQPVFFYASLQENLTFGLTNEDREKDEESGFPRVRAICEQLGVSTLTLSMLGSKTKRDWSQMLSISQLKSLHLARAFIANPEVLVMEKPTTGFDVHSAANILSLLREHISSKGLAVDSGDHEFARPRTVIFSTENITACRVADIVYKVEPTRIVEVDGQTVTAEDILPHVREPSVLE